MNEEVVIKWLNGVFKTDKFKKIQREQHKNFWIDPIYKTITTINLTDKITVSKNNLWINGAPISYPQDVKDWMDEDDKVRIEKVGTNVKNSWQDFSQPTIIKPKEFKKTEEPKKDEIIGSKVTIPYKGQTKGNEVQKSVKRGRPRKTTATATKPKGKRGRPKKA